MSHFKKAALALAVASTFTLVGCSNSSSSGSESITPDASTQSVSGAAVKGVLKNAQVTVYELNDSGDRIGEVGAATTNDDGEYEAALASAYKGGLLEIEVTSIPGQTRMVCDATACGTVQKGQDFELPDGFKLSAIAAKEEGSDKVSAPVTAWSTMAVNRARRLVSEGGSMGEASRRASDEVSLVAGFDVSRTAARDINKLDGATEQEAQAAAMNAVIAEAVFAIKDGEVLDFVNRFDSLSKVLEDGALNEADGELKTALADATVKVSQDASIPLSESVRKELDQVAGQVTEGIDVSKSTDSELDFRGFVSQVRAWASSIEAINGDDLSAAVKADSETIKNIFSASTEGQFEFLGHVLDAANEFLVNNPEQVSTFVNSGGAQTVNVEDDDGRSVGSATLSFSDSNGLNIGITGRAGTGQVFEPVDLLLSTSIPVAQLDVVAQPDEEGSINLLINSLQKDTSMVLTGTIGNNLITLNELSVNLTLQEGITTADAGGFFDDPDNIEAKFASAKLAGDVIINSAEGDRFSGQLEVGLTRLNDGDRPYSALNFTRVSLERFRVSGGFDSANPEVGSFDASVQLNVRNGAEFDVLSWGEYSSQTRWLPLTATTDELSFLAEPFPSDVVIGFFEGGFDADYQNQWGYGEYFVDDGQSRVNSYYPSNSNLESIVDEVTGKVFQKLQSLEGRFVVESWETEQILYEFSPEEFTALPLIDGTVAFDPETSGKIYLSFDAGQINVSDGATLAFIDTNDQRLNVGSVWSNGESGSTLNFNAYYDQYPLTGAAQLIGEPNPLAEVDAAALVSVDESTYRGYRVYFDSWSGDLEYSGSVRYEIPVSLARFESCMGDAPVELKKLTGWTYSGLSETDALRQCAQNTLASDSIDITYPDDGASPVDLSQLEDVGRTIMASALGDLSADTSNYHAELVFGSAAVDLENPGTIDVLADFPDLETADYFLNGSITIKAEVELPELPLAQATVTLDRSAQKGGSVLANLIWNGGNYSVKVASTDVEQLTNVTAEFFNAEGHRLELTPSFDEEKNLVALSGKAIADGEQVGTIVLRDTPAGKMPVIEYNSGSEIIVETLF